MNKKNSKGFVRWVTAVACVLVLTGNPCPGATTPESDDTITLHLRNADIAEVFEMLSRKERVNILLSKAVSGTVSVNLYEVELDWAIRVIAEAAGFAVERRDGTYLVIERGEAGKDAVGGLTEIRSFKVQYSDPQMVAEILGKHLSRYGQITTLDDRSLLLVDDLPDFLEKMDRLLRVIDVPPQQILIEAKVLEITLDDGETFGFDWRAIFNPGDATGTVGTRGFTVPGSPGLFFSFVNDNIEAFLDTLTTRGRVRTLSTPKLLALENQEAEVLIGERLGYRVTTTINQVTTESVEYLDSGVILRVLPSVDEAGRVVMEIHPEVSTGTIIDGLPNQVTTEVTTQLVAEDGQTIFIAGLIKDRSTESFEGVPVLGSIPVFGRLFSRREDVTINTETVVLITPHIVTEEWWQAMAQQGDRVDRMADSLSSRGERIDVAMDKYDRLEEVVHMVPKERREGDFDVLGREMSPTDYMP